MRKEHIYSLPLSSGHSPTPLSALMEKLQGPINSFVLEEKSDVGFLEEEDGVLGRNCAPLLAGESFRFAEFREEKASDCRLPSFEDKMPFLQMLQGIENPLPIQETDLPFLLGLLHREKQVLPWESSSSYLTSSELESSVSNNGMATLKSLVESEAKGPQILPPNSAVNLNSEFNRGEKFTLGRTQDKSKQTQLAKSPLITKERRKRSRTRPQKNQEEADGQRMTHIAIERNRRRQMNDHFAALQSLMPPSYIQRGDQASIIGGAIDFVKELEQLLQSLQAQKRMRQQSEENGDILASTSSSSSSSNLLNNNVVMKPEEVGNAALDPGAVGGSFTAENRSVVADVEAVVIRNHVNLKFECRKGDGLLVKAVLALEDLRLTVLHLNITSFHSLSVHYSINLKAAAAAAAGGGGQDRPRSDEVMFAS
ncbi:hypothetical protein Nepgr_033168 [Nepenthes gracilis]|uniref:BHLH domain-containing protein n=1 Tax=Nepenthes gracilis TaxID=150966 RepID=A0AAD3TK14_NEPGR|nr:hypothetical protein Nepgr_033168 [Nepenthes gracilis]